MRTKGDCIALFLRYLDEATKKGVDLPTTKNADYRDKFNYFLNEAQTYVAGIVKIPAVFQVTQNPIPNQLGLLQGFELRQYLPNKPIILTGEGTKSYYFEMDDIGTATIAVNGVAVKTIDNLSRRSFTPHRGNIEANEGDIVTITFSGDYPYNIRNTALYGYAFPADEDVPSYSPYVEYDVPDDFMMFDTVIIKKDPRTYEPYQAFRWENNKKVILEYFKTGSFDIHYFKYPAYIPPDAPAETPLEVEDKAIDLVVLQAGIKATASDNQQLSAWLRSLYVEQVQNIAGLDQPQETSVQTIFMMG